MKSYALLAAGYVSASMCVCLLADACFAEDAAIDPATLVDHTSSFESFAENLEPFVVSVFWENDGSILKRNNARDRHYTNGNAITFAHQPDWADGFADVATFGESFDRTAAGYILGQMIFTPEDIATTRLVRDDRPYAGYLFAGVYVQRANGDTFDHAQLDIGLVGPASQADHMQKDIHDWLDIDEPKGWDNQLHDEVTAQITLRRKWRVDLEPVSLLDYTIDHQLIPQVELAAGSVYRHVGAGATWRVGCNLPDDFGPARMGDVGAATDGPDKHPGGYGFIRVSGRAVEHNMFLEGNNFRSSHGVDAEPFVGELQAGVAAYLTYDAWTFQAVYSQTFITEQFEDQRGADAFGALSVSVSRGF